MSRAQEVGFSTEISTPEIPQVREMSEASTRALAEAAVMKGIDMSWVEFALCAQTDPEAFFPDKGGGDNGTTRAAKRICLECFVREECLNYALTMNEDHGIWGGLGVGERRELRKKKAAA